MLSNILLQMNPFLSKLLQDDRGIIFEVKHTLNPLKIQDKIFDDFYRENDARGGFG